MSPEGGVTRTHTWHSVTCACRLALDLRPVGTQSREEVFRAELSATPSCLCDLGQVA